MLQRILEPELMDSPEEALAYDAMDHGEVNRKFVDDLLEALGQQSTCRFFAAKDSGSRHRHGTNSHRTLSPSETG